MRQRLRRRQKTGQAGRLVDGIVQYVVDNLALHDDAKQDGKTAGAVRRTNLIVERRLAIGGHRHHAKREAHNGFPVADHLVKPSIVATGDRTITFNVPKAPQVLGHGRTDAGLLKQMQRRAALVGTTALVIAKCIDACAKVEQRCQRFDLQRWQRPRMAQLVENVECHNAEDAQRCFRPNRQEQRKATHNAAQGNEDGKDACVPLS